MIYCPDCEKELEIHDTLYSNITTKRCNEGDHTGDIYWCDECEKLWKNDFLDSSIEEWSYALI